MLIGLIMEGYILIYKKLLEWEWYKNSNVKIVFLHCLLKANYKDKKWQGYDIKRSQFITSIRAISNELNMTESQVRTSLKKLEKTCELNVKPFNKQFTQITVCNYDSYQITQKQNDKQNENELTNESQTDDKRIAITNEYNKENKENKSVKNEFSQDSENFVIWFKNLIPENLFPKGKQIADWQKCYDDLINIDKRTKKEIAKVCEFARNDTFWIKNFLTPLKLRKKSKEGVNYYDMILEQMKNLKNDEEPKPYANR